MLAPDTPEAPRSGDSLFETGAARGTSRVICFSPDHGKSLPEPALPALEEVVDTWCRESADRGAHYLWVQVFENKGAMMGCSNPHPHGQIWANSFLPTEATLEDQRQADCAT